MGARRDAFALGKSGKDGIGDKVQLRGTSGNDMADALDLKLAWRLLIHSPFLSFFLSFSLQDGMYAK